MVATGAIKNLYGYLPGSSKGEYHYRLKTREWLAELQLDLAVVLPPVLNIIDAIVGMEGEGPSGGTPRQLGFLAASTETVALDMVTFRAMKLNLEQIPLLVAAKNRQFGTTDWSKIEIVGATMEELICPDFKPIRQLNNPLKILPLPQKILDFVQHHWKALPRIDSNKCVKCMRCRDGCPVKPPAIDPNCSVSANSTRCIKCYCCHEFCPVKAIDVNPTWLERFVLTGRIREFASHLAGIFKRH
jgi:ferredoxin